MDRKIDPKIIRQRKIKRIITLTAIMLIACIIFIGLARLLQPGISAGDIYTSTVDRGTIEISIPATGKIIPLSEEIIISPVSTKIVEVYKKAGDQVNEGDVILKLDLAAINTEIEKQDNELKMKLYKLEQEKITSQSTLSDLEMQIEIDEMQIKRMEVLLKNERYLDSIGAGTSDKIKQAELNYTVEQLKLKQLKRKYENQKSIIASDNKVLELDYSIALQNARLKNKTMAEAQVRSPRSATLTWVNDQQGAKVPEGAQLAIVSDLSHYKVEAEVSESYGNRILSGSNAIIKISGKELRGKVGNVVPSVKNGIITFSILLDDNQNEILRSGLKIDVHVIHSVQDNVLRIANRSYYTGAGEYELWVIRNGEAGKRKVTLGESSYNYVEVKDGLSEGEIVITSDMSRYAGKKKLKVRGQKP
ncbi:MAG: HlyD family efflux transporter periplasmic adaptor subunit [Dysgonamonadaceae bacterium]|jgi:HlyD family secretion protein|nr:HlyD family efflux transporter periplasmic adaptor subunit [Dysgonamonadaceae bacterium]